MDVNCYDAIADLYDIYVAVTFDVDFFVEETKKAAGEVLELMSGTGRVSVPLAEAGVKLSCADVSAASNAILRKKLSQRGLKADVYQMDVCKLELRKKFDMVIIPFHSFAHLVSVEDQRQALTRIREHLLPGGTFICTLRNPNLRQKEVDGQLRFFGKYPLPEAQGTLLFWTIEDHNADDERIVEATQLYEEYDAQGVLKSKRILELHFRLSSRDEFEGLARAAGFKPKAFYGDYSRSDFKDDSPFMIWLLENAGQPSAG